MGAAKYAQITACVPTRFALQSLLALPHRGASTAELERKTTSSFRATANDGGLQILKHTMVALTVKSFVVALPAFRRRTLAVRAARNTAKG